MTKHASLYESPKPAPKLHPFGGKFRTVQQIADICGMTTATVDNYINRGESIPFSSARVKWLRGQEGGKKAAKGKDGVDTSPRYIWIDGMKYQGIAPTAKRFKISFAKLSKMSKLHGENLTSEILFGP